MGLSLEVSGQVIRGVYFPHMSTDGERTGSKEALSPPKSERWVRRGSLLPSSHLAVHETVGV